MNKMIVLKQGILIVISILSITLFSCINDKPRTEGEGTVTTRVLSVSDFSGVDLTFANNVTIKQGDIQEVKATGHPNIIDKISTSVSNDIWKIGLENGWYRNYDLSIEITISNLDRLELSGSGNLVVNDFINQNTLDIVISGSGNINLREFEGSKNLNVNLSGSGDFKANKDIITLNDLTVENSGSGNYLGFEISSNNVTIISSGSGICEFTAVNSLNAMISGSGNVYYEGIPSIKQNITGSGKLINAN